MVGGGLLCLLLHIWLHLNSPSGVVMFGMVFSVSLSLPLYLHINSPLVLVTVGGSTSDPCLSLSPYKRILGGSGGWGVLYLLFHLGT